MEVRHDRVACWPPAQQDDPNSLLCAHTLDVGETSPTEEKETKLESQKTGCMLTTWLGGKQCTYSMTRHS